MGLTTADLMHLHGDLASLQVLHPAEGLSREMALLSAVANGSMSAGFLIWRCQQSLVVPRSVARKPQFAFAASRMEADGWPVQLRDTGGDLTPQSPGLINVALAFSRQRAPGAIRDSYQTLCRPLIDYLRACGIAAHCASVDGAFCDGDYNLVVDGRKLAGTAQRWRRMSNGGADEFAVLAHVVLLCDEPMERLCQAGNRFYQRCALPSHIDDSCHITLAELLPERQPTLLTRTIHELEDRLTEYITTL